MRSWLSDYLTDAKSKTLRDIPIALSLYNLSNKMGNSLLAVRLINHIFIVVDAPIVQEFPLTLECKVVEDKMEVYGHHVIGEIVGVLADESVLDETGKVDATKLNAFVFDQFRNGYYAIGEKVGQAWHTGTALMKK